MIYDKFSNEPFTGTTSGKTQRNYKEGKKDGKWLSYYDNGQILEEVNYKKGYYDGKNITFHSNGEVKSTGLWTNGYGNARCR